jgi:hypothetical protein
MGFRLPLKWLLAHSWLLPFLVKVDQQQNASSTLVENSNNHLFLKNADFIQDLYLNELRAYKPSKAASAEKADLVDKFILPTPPQAPALETVSAAEVDDSAAMQEEAWPALYNPIVRIYTL